jgi:PPM family protein phosphatase
MAWIFGVQTDRGKRRPRNEDAVLSMPDAGLFAVADGMGGHAGGDVASRLAVGALESTWASAPLRADARAARLANAGGAGAAADAIDRAASAVQNGGRDAAQLEHRLRLGFAAARDAIRAAATARPELAEMGTTLTAVAFDGDGATALVGHIGDSRLYMLRAGELHQLTRDDTWVQEQVEAGILTARQARRHPRSAVLTRVIGTRESDPPATAAVTTRPGDTLLLCSDGLSGMISDEEIATLLGADAPPDTLAAELIDAANRRGGADNISVIVLRRSDPPG